MPLPSFSCPYCSAPLRIKNRALIGKRLACPDCGKPILISSAGPRELSLQKVSSKSRSKTARKKTQEKHKKPDRLSRWLSVLQSPVGISWLVAGLLVFMLFLAAWPFGNSDSQDRSPLHNAQENSSSDNEENRAAEKFDPAKIAKLPNASNDVVDLKNVFPPPVVAEKPVSLIEADQKQKQQSVPLRDPVAATIPPDSIDVKAALSQPILQYQLEKAVSLRKLLMDVEEMAGVPIRFDDSARAEELGLLDKPVSLRLEKTTVGEILKTLLKQVNLEYELGFNEIRIVSPKPESTEENP
ncbi:MAG: hypothetical protein IID46_14645 [Planctomycetes bacterium]|nr:hypothetical protein [Planctomycetota bacterium]